ncbi:MAG: biotin carboxylase N-terminal domain-containing protein [Myxococcota bacterium]
MLGRSGATVFETLLIAGQGEVAKRVEQTCRRIGLDLASAEGIEGNAWHPSPDGILQAASRTGATAVHPGYVAPRARTEIARAVFEKGLAFVGPSLTALEYIEDKPKMRDLARELGLPVLPGTAAVEDPEEARRAADELDYPLAIKSVAGTAALGLRLAEDEDDFANAFAEAQAEANEHFGIAAMYLERWLEKPRQIEVTVVADMHGRRATLGERECSLQRRSQVLVAESPSPLLAQCWDGETKREVLSEACLGLAEGIGLQGVATFEFLVDVEGVFYFLEANADMHGATLVTEMLTGLDPIELQLEIAAGNPLGESARFRTNGHAFEVRVCAEDPSQGFSRDDNPVDSIQFPPAAPSKVRIERAIEPGEAATARAEPLVARVATFAPIRHHALLRLDRTLAEASVEPVQSNLSFLRQVLGHEAFRAGQYDTGFAQRILR